MGAYYGDIVPLSLLFSTAMCSVWVWYVYYSVATGKCGFYSKCLLYFTLDTIGEGDVEVRGQLTGVGSGLLPYRSWD